MMILFGQGLAEVLQIHWLSLQTEDFFLGQQNNTDLLPRSPSFKNKDERFEESFTNDLLIMLLAITHLEFWFRKLDSHLLDIYHANKGCCFHSEIQKLVNVKKMLF